MLARSPVFADASVAEEDVGEDDDDVASAEVADDVVTACWLEEPPEVEALATAETLVELLAADEAEETSRVA